ncbi:hypothetical protein SAMN05216302_103531 [Nitrosomonas aestuarii]|uniref:Uncharacterized protein n=1 Tax=Nitrosomonas aestuarii TaxID=52441 RepID=A0A1I4FCA7_9PROT|nr:hypothetical protein [Nitrosomonas aestuarii]SFL15103.1 hypothetical protein SAMN05216302_103531 [Nitrosomonas aestuarii]
MLFDFKSKEDLINRAKDQAKKAPNEFKTSIELYYIARYFVSAFEARYHVVPIQIWNEYRNALDHFFRHITSVGFSEESENLKRMEGHIKRAALDVIKITCHESDKWLDEEVSKYHSSALLFVDNGDFVALFKSKQEKARSVFLNAKTEDYKFGIDSSTNKSILTLYIDAAIAYEELVEITKNKTPALLKAEIRYQEIRKDGENSGRKDTFIQNLAVGGTCLILGLIIQSLLK